MARNRSQRIVAKDDRTMTIRFKIDANVQFLSRVVQVLDARGCAIDLEFEIVFDVLCRSTVGVGRLDDANLQLVG